MSAPDVLHHKRQRHHEDAFPAPAAIRPNVDIRTIPPGSNLAIAQLSAKLIHETDPDAFDKFEVQHALAAIELMTDEPYCQALGAYVSQELVGMLLLGGYELSESAGGRVLIISSFYILPAYRGRGVGRGLYAAAKRMARSLGAVGMQLHVHNSNLSAQAVYEELGIRMTEYVLMREHF